MLYNFPHSSFPTVPRTIYIPHDATDDLPGGPEEADLLCGSEGRECKLRSHLVTACESVVSHNIPLQTSWVSVELWVPSSSWHAMCYFQSSFSTIGPMQKHRNSRWSRGKEGEGLHSKRSKTNDYIPLPWHPRGDLGWQNQWLGSLGHFGQVFLVL